MTDGLMQPTLSEGALVSVERHHALSEIAALWQLDVETVRRLFQNEPGVVVLQSTAKKGKRAYKTLRIPQSVLERVHKRLQR